MKKQNKEKESASADAKQNSNADSNETRPAVSDETKQKIVQQYRDRAEASPSRSWDENIGGHFDPDDYFKNGPQYGWPQNKNIDVQYRPSGETINPAYNAAGNYLADVQGAYGVLQPSLNPEDHPIYFDEMSPRGEALGNRYDFEGAFGGNGISQLNHDRDFFAIKPFQLEGVVNAMSNDAMINRGDTNLKPNMLYGYGDAPLDYYSQYEDVEDRPEGYHALYNDYLREWYLDSWLNNSDIANREQDRRDLATAFNLMQNANDYDRQQNLEQMAQQYRNEDLYGDALMELQEKISHRPSHDRSLIENAFQEARHQQRMDDLARQARQRNITGSAVW